MASFLCKSLPSECLFPPILAPIPYSQQLVVIELREKVCLWCQFEVSTLEDWSNLNRICQGYRTIHRTPECHGTDLARKSLLPIRRNSLIDFGKMVRRSVVWCCAHTRHSSVGRVDPHLPPSDCHVSMLTI